MSNFAVPGTSTIDTTPGLKGHKKKQSVSLASLPAGQLATIVSLQGSPHEIARVAEMGLHRGVEVVVIRNGITAILQLNHSRICVRLSKDLTVLATPF